MDQTPRSQEPQSVFRDDELNMLLTGIKDHLRETTGARAIQQEQGDPLKDGTYIVNESDILRLLHYILDMTDQLCMRRESNGIASTDAVVGRSFSQGPRFMCPAASTTAEPATTLTISEATFTPAVGTDDEARLKAQTSTTATVISRDNITNITWLKSMKPTSAPRAELEGGSNPTSPPGMPDMTDQLYMTGATSSVHCPVLPQPDKLTSSGSHTNVTVDCEFRSLIGTNIRKKRQRSTMVSTDGDEPEPEEGLGQPATVLEKMRKKSVQFGQAVGSFINGAYRNADHKPRRESSVARMKGILDRLQPSRLQKEEDMVIYSAFTGAQPVTPIDQYNARTRRPGPPSNTCSEDGRWHKCVQHETDTPPG